MWQNPGAESQHLTGPGINHVWSLQRALGLRQPGSLWLYIWRSIYNPLCHCHCSLLFCNAPQISFVSVLVLFSDPFFLCRLPPITHTKQQHCHSEYEFQDQNKALCLEICTWSGEHLTYEEFQWCATLKCPKSCRNRIKCLCI